MIEILQRVLNMDCKWPKLAFCSEYLCFIILRGDLNTCSWETGEKLTRLCSSSMDVLPSKSSSRSRDWKLSFESIVIFQVHAIQQYKIDIFCRICKVQKLIKRKIYLKEIVFKNIWHYLFCALWAGLTKAWNTKVFSTPSRKSDYYASFQKPGSERNRFCFYL